MTLDTREHPVAAPPPRLRSSAEAAVRVADGGLQ